MKYFIVLVCVFAAFKASDADSAKFDKAKADCVAEKSVDQNTLAEAQKGHFKDGDNLNCFAECLFRKAGFLSEDGAPNVEAMKTAAKESAGEKGPKHIPAVEKCVSKTGKDACETSHAIFRCYWEEFNA